MDELKFREALRIIYNMIAGAFDTGNLADNEVQGELIDMLLTEIGELNDARQEALWGPRGICNWDGLGF